MAYEIKPNLAYTYYFEEVFPDLQSFNEFITEYSLIDMTESEDVYYVRYFYQILVRHFNHSNIRYDNMDSFKAEFLNVFEDVFFKFKREKQLIEEAYKLSLEDLQELNTLISNNAKRPNTEIVNPKNLIKYIGEQNSVFTNGNKLEAYLRAVANMPMLGHRKFIAEFKYLFMAILPAKKILWEV